jgi:hypothetical protein
LAPNAGRDLLHATFPGGFLGQATRCLLERRHANRRTGFRRIYTAFIQGDVPTILDRFASEESGDALANLDSTAQEYIR